MKGVDDSTIAQARALIDALEKAGIKSENPGPIKKPEDYYSYLSQVLEKQVGYLRKQNQELEDKMKAEKITQQEEKKD